MRATSRGAAARTARSPRPFLIGATSSPAELAGDLCGNHSELGGYAIEWGPKFDFHTGSSGTPLGSVLVDTCSALRVLEADFDGLMRSHGLPMRLHHAQNIISHHLPSNLTRAAVARRRDAPGRARGLPPTTSRCCPPSTGPARGTRHYLEPYELTDRPRVRRAGSLNEDAGPVFVALWRVTSTPSTRTTQTPYIRVKHTVH